MKYTTGTYTFDGKTYKAIEVDYESYSKEYGQMQVLSKLSKAEKVYGVEQPIPTIVAIVKPELILGTFVVKQGL